jgi:hypothetical protein
MVTGSPFTPKVWGTTDQLLDEALPHPIYAIKFNNRRTRAFIVSETVVEKSPRDKTDFKVKGSTRFSQYSRKELHVNLHYRAEFNRNWSQTAKLKSAQPAFGGNAP